MARLTASACSALRRSAHDLLDSPDFLEPKITDYG